MKIDYALLAADAAQAVGGKIFVLGGGWNVISQRRNFPAPVQHAIAAGVGISRTKKLGSRHPLKIAVIDETGVAGDPGVEWSDRKPASLRRIFHQDCRSISADGVESQVFRCLRPGRYRIVISVRVVAGRGVVRRDLRRPKVHGSPPTRPNRPASAGTDFPRADLSRHARPSTIDFPAGALDAWCTPFLQLSPDVSFLVDGQMVSVEAPLEVFSTEGACARVMEDNSKQEQPQNGQLRKRIDGPPLIRAGSPF